MRELARKLFIPGKEHSWPGNVWFRTDVYRSEVGIFFCLLTLMPAGLAAQAPDDINAKFQAMEQRIKALESEVSTLKAALAATPAAPEAPAPQAAAQLPLQAPAIPTTSSAPQLSDA